VINKHIIQRDLARFGIRDEITGITPHIQYNGLSSQPPAYKLVAALAFAGRKPLIVKYVKEKRTNTAYLREQYQLSSLFLRHGIPTARRLMTPDHQDHVAVIYQGQELLLTLEEDIGPEIPLATLALCQQAGSLLGRMHRAVIQENFHMKEGRVIFDWMRNSDVDAGKKLMDLLASHGRHQEHEAVRACYEARRALLRARWGNLPHYAVQGDLSINNLTRGAQGELMVFDYNCAGEAPLLSDAVLQALFFAREMPYDDFSSHDERFTAFFSAYQAQRPLTAIEIGLWKPLYQAADAFWFTRYVYGDDTLDNQLAQDRTMPLDSIMDSIRELLEKEPPR
jgi:Ser/Thr protein kinase RdoA (MazF antagonist)